MRRKWRLPMAHETRYLALRIFGRIHRVIGGVVLGVALVLGGFTGLVGLFGAAHYGIRGQDFYPGSALVMGAGIAMTLITVLAGALIVGIGEAFRALADMADNSDRVLLALAALRGDPRGGSESEEDAAAHALPGPTEL
jgi:hypothetical protein